MVTQSTPAEGNDLAGSWEGAEADSSEQETPAPAVAEAEAPPETEQEKPEAEAAGELERVRRELNRLRSQQGQESAKKRDLLIQENADRLGAIEKVLDRLASRLVKGDEDAGFETDLAAIKTESQKTAAERRWDARYEELKGALNEAIYDDDGTVVLTAQSPELTEARTRWNQALKDQDEAGLNAAIRMTLKARVAVERQRATDAAKAVAPPKPKGPDMTITPGSTGAGVAVTMDNIDNLMTRVGEFPVAKQEEIRAKYRALMRNGAF